MLDAGKEVIQWNGSKAGIMEKAKVRHFSAFSLPPSTIPVLIIPRRLSWYKPSRASEMASPLDAWLVCNHHLRPIVSCSYIDVQLNLTTMRASSSCWEARVPSPTLQQEVLNTRLNIASSVFFFVYFNSIQINFPNRIGS